MKSITHVLLAMALVASIACSREPETPAQQSSPQPASGAAATGTSGASVDSSFVREQLDFGEKEVGLAQVAAERASRPELKEFAQMLERDHRQATDDLRRIASNSTVRSARSEQLKVERDRLSKLSGAEFDREFLDEIIADHQDAARDLEAVVKDENAQVREWASRHLPVVKRHLERARELRGQGASR